jgi:predicted phosphohydrolase
MFGSREASLEELLHRRRPSVWSEFLSHPVLFLAQKIYGWHRILSAAPPSPITVVCISDTHNCQPCLPDGDILIHAGDLTQSGSLSEIHSTLDWLNRQSHRYKVVIAGNHDLILDSSISSHPNLNCRQDIRWGDVIYLQNESITVKCSHDRNIKIYGSPWTPKHGNWAFQYSRTTDIWHGTIPADTDILITHVPPKGHLDLNGLGCKFLLRELWRLQRKPRLHVFGHVHEGYGIEQARFDSAQRAYDNVVLSEGGFLWLLYLLYIFLSAIHDAGRSMTSTWFVNASIVGGLRDEKRRKPIIVHI